MLAKKLRLKRYKEILFRIVKTKGNSLEENDGITTCYSFKCNQGTKYSELNEICGVCDELLDILEEKDRRLACIPYDQKEI